MRLKLSMLFILVAMIALVFGILFMTPLFIAGAFCVVTIILTPAFWLTGAMYARGIWRPFFIGGILTGLVPHLVVLFQCTAAAFTSGVNGLEMGLNLGLSPEEMLTARLYVAGIWATPGVFAILGGAVSMLTYRLVRGSEKPVDLPDSVSLQPPEYP